MHLPSAVAAAVSPWERLAKPTLIAAETPAAAECLARWQAALAGAAEPAGRLAKRLAWDGLTPAAVLPALEAALPEQAAPMPEWAALLAEVAPLARALAAANPHGHRALRAGRPVQYEEVLLPFVLAGAGRLQARVRPAAYARFSSGAHADLERGLLAHLCGQALPTLQLSFSLFRVLHPPAPADPPRARYLAFVQALLTEGLDSLLDDYRALARLLAQATAFWVAATAELLERLDADWPRLQAEFGLPEAMPPVTAVRVSLSDPHREARTVAILTLEGGARLVYKPRSLGLDLAFARLLAWINAQGGVLDLKPLKVLECGTHGWMEYIAQRACGTEAEVRRYYERAGQLLCLAYVLHGADIHAENIIAHGEHPVLIDLEMIFQANLRQPLDPPGQAGGPSPLQQRVLNSVGRTLLLPAWELGPSGRAADVSGLGAVTEAEAAFQQPHWQNVNTDAMALEQKYPALQPGHNTPRLNDQTADPNAYQEDLTAGFERLYRWLMAHRAAVPLALFAGQSARFLLRATQLYFLVLGKALGPQHLHTGTDRAIQLDVVTRLFLRYADRPAAWPLARAEIQSLFQGDIPYFTYPIDSVDLPVGPGVVIANFFEKSGYQAVAERLAGLNDADLGFQLALIRGSLNTRAAAAPRPADPIAPGTARRLTDAELIGHAVTLADELEHHALRFGETAGWLGYHFLPRAGRYQMQPLDFDLYNGTAGIALFLSALEKTVGGAGRYRALALAALNDLRRAALAARPEHFAYARLGGGEGLGSLIYGLVRSGELLGEADLVAAARRLARAITPAQIQNDREYDTLSGTAGAVLGLLALHAAAGDQHALDLAVLGGDHLLAARVEAAAGRRAWPTLAGVAPAGKLPAGMAHGAAGIAYALLRLAAVTGEARFTAAAAEAVAYEAAAFVPGHGNWAGYPPDDQAPASGYLVAWCSGAPGIALARLGGLPVLDTPAVRADIENALRTTLQAGAAPLDHCCCGSSGRAEALLVAAQRLQRPALAEQARQLLSWVVAEREAAGAHRFLAGLPAGTYHPGFFQGAAGIGYQCLRLAYPAQLPSVLLWE